MIFDNALADDAKVNPVSSVALGKPSAWPMARAAQEDASRSHDPNAPLSRVAMNSGTPTGTLLDRVAKNSGVSADDDTLLSRVARSSDASAECHPRPSSARHSGVFSRVAKQVRTMSSVGQRFMVDPERHRLSIGGGLGSVDDDRLSRISVSSDDTNTRSSRVFSRVANQVRTMSTVGQHFWVDPDRHRLSIGGGLGYVDADDRFSRVSCAPGEDGGAPDSESASQ
jgi:hypothetical protein